MTLNGFGFIFNYNKRLSKSKVIPKNDVLEINPDKRNTDEIPLFVNCKPCNELMDFEIGPEDCLDGKWVCPICRSTVKEQTVYKQLDRENEESIYDNQDLDDEPECCRACGGPWPDCESSCKIFDE